MVIFAKIMLNAKHLWGFWHILHHLIKQIKMQFEKIAVSMEYIY